MCAARLVSAAIRFAGYNFVNEAWLETSIAEAIALVMYVALIAYFVWESKRPDKN